jgi:hypothetical protein
MRYASDSDDYVHSCNRDVEVLKNESVKIVGNWTDSNGNTGTRNKMQVCFAGIENNAFGTEAWAIDKVKVHTKNDFGDDESTHRTRPHSEYIEVK